MEQMYTHIHQMAGDFGKPQRTNRLQLQFHSPREKKLAISDCFPPRTFCSLSLFWDLYKERAEIQAKGFLILHNLRFFSLSRPYGGQKGGLEQRVFVLLVGGKGGPIGITRVCVCVLSQPWPPLTSPWRRSRMRMWTLWVAEWFMSFYPLLTLEMSFLFSRKSHFVHLAGMFNIWFLARFLSIVCAWYAALNLLIHRNLSNCSWCNDPSKLILCCSL